MLHFISGLLGITSAPPAAPGALSAFLSGASVPQAAASAYGGGENLTSGQRWLESEFRGYVRDLEDEIADLERENAQLRAALDPSTGSGQACARG